MRITVGSVEARLHRLERLSRGLALEIEYVREADDPLLYLERRGYLDALRDALVGVESARVVMSCAVGRLRQGRAA